MTCARNRFEMHLGAPWSTIRSPMSFELRHLRYFQVVAEELSFSRAARRLNVAQPALSRAVQQLEEALGAVVLERTRHRVRLTPAGTVLLRETGALLQQ